MRRSLAASHQLPVAPASSGGMHTHDPANRAPPQRAMRQARANNVPPAGGGGPHQGGTTVMITVSVSKVTRRVTFDTETVITGPPPARTYRNTRLTGTTRPFAGL
jgi:hypothetical protein